MSFAITETMAGRHTPVEGGKDHPFEFEVTWGPGHLREWANPLSERFGWNRLAGRVRAGGLFDWTPCEGSLSLEYARGRIIYAFDAVVDGRPVRFHGEKVNIRPWNLSFSHTTCFGTLVDLESGRLLSRVVVGFRMRDMPRFLGSLRWVRG
jgi:hypothetical protein